MPTNHDPKMYSYYQRGPLESDKTPMHKVKRFVARSSCLCNNEGRMTNRFG